VYYWQLLVMARKLVLVVIEKIFSDKPSMQFELGFVVLGGALLHCSCASSRSATTT
jgi:hypothetical protein